MELIQEYVNYLMIKEQGDMIYLRWNKEDVENISSFMEIENLLTEVNSDGVVTREIGLNKDDILIYKAPSKTDMRGLFDNQIIDIEGKQDEILPETFKDYWNCNL